MGSGTSKEGNNVVKFEDSEDDDDWTGRKVEKKNEEKKKETSVLGNVFNKQKQASISAPALQTRKIVGESSSSSDEDEDYHRDVQLKNDIHQLERALNNVDTKFDRESRSSRHVHVSAPVARYEDPPPYSRGIESAEIGGVIARDKLKYKQLRKRSDLKFSWDDRNDLGHMSEDWSLKQVKIEGFDAAKFKAANNKVGGSSSNIRPAVAINNNSSTLGAVPSFAQPPGFVPTYDHSEQQLLASLERELGF